MLIVEGVGVGVDMLMVVGVGVDMLMVVGVDVHMLIVVGVGVDMLMVVGVGVDTVPRCPPVMLLLKRPLQPSLIRLGRLGWAGLRIAPHRRRQTFTISITPGLSFYIYIRWSPL